MAVDDRFAEDFRQTREDEPLGTRSPVITGPVTDWATDFSHVQPEWAADPYPIQDDLRQRCPIAHTERFGGAWLPTRYEDVAAIAYDTDHFSSRSIIFPPEDGPQFREFVEDLLEGINLPPDERIARVSRLFDYLLAQVDDHLGNPRQDLTDYLINAELYGRKLDPAHVVGTMALLLIAGIDTTWSAIGASLWHLAKTPGDRRRLVAEPRLLLTAVEEFLRAYAPVTMARLVKEDMHWRGVDMKADDWILLSFPAANRDPEQFERAGEVVIDRDVNRHAAFGLGIHRCLGSHLARMELRVALQAWLERIPEFALEDPSAVTWSAGQIRGPRTLPLRIQ